MRALHFAGPGLVHMRHVIGQRLGEAPPVQQNWNVRRPGIAGSNRAGALHKRIAFSSIASKTGVRLPGEELMTCKTSAVAVCCSRASRVSVISRAFSIAITACAAKFCKSAISLSENGRTS